MNTRPCDALATCPNCGTWVRTGQSYLPGYIHATCPATTTAPEPRKVRIHPRTTTVKGTR